MKVGKILGISAVAMSAMVSVSAHADQLSGSYYIDKLYMMPPADKEVTDGQYIDNIAVGDMGKTGMTFEIKQKGALAQMDTKMLKKKDGKMKTVHYTFLCGGDNHMMHCVDTSGEGKQVMWQISNDGHSSVTVLMGGGVGDKKHAVYWGELLKAEDK